MNLIPLLKVLLYMNLIYFPFWVSVALLVSSLKLQLLSQLYQFILLTVLTAFIAIEVVRLYLGYLGTYLPITFVLSRDLKFGGFWNAQKDT